MQKPLPSLPAASTLTMATSRLQDLKPCTGTNERTQAAERAQLTGFRASKQRYRISKRMTGTHQGTKTYFLTATSKQKTSTQLRINN